MLLAVSLIILIIGKLKVHTTQILKRKICSRNINVNIQ